VVGVSAYFPLVDSPPTRVLSVSELEDQWIDVFEEYFVPLRNMYPDKPIVLLEYGYQDSVIAPYDIHAEVFEPRVFIDMDTNGVDDGEEQQANIHQAFFNILDIYDYVVLGAFFWNMGMITDEVWLGSYGKIRDWSVKGRPAEVVLKNKYKSWKENYD
jgi:hypothetical protein